MALLNKHARLIRDLASEVRLLKAEVETYVMYQAREKLACEYLIECMKEINSGLPVHKRFRINEMLENVKRKRHWPI